MTALEPAACRYGAPGAVRYGAPGAVNPVIIEYKKPATAS